MDNVCNYRRIADVINKAAPDIVAVQELDSMTNRSGKKYVLGELATLTGMHAYYAPAIKHDGGKYGIGILSKSSPGSFENDGFAGKGRISYVGDGRI